MNRPLEIQGHRGARALRPENTIPSFKAALDAGAGSIETDLQLSRDGAIVLCHDSQVGGTTCCVYADGQTCEMHQTVRLSTLDSTAARRLIADRNPLPRRFSRQRSERTELCDWFANEHFLPSRHPYAIPFLEDLVGFVKAYAGQAGATHGKSAEQRANAARVVFDLEIKSEPFEAPIAESLLLKIAAIIRGAEMVERCRIRSFDHRIIKRFREVMPEVPTGVLIAGTTVVDPVRLCRDAGATFYCPEYWSLAEGQVKQLHGEGIRIIPWTVNERAAWQRLVEWQVHGICTDDPAALADFLRDK